MPNKFTAFSMLAIAILFEPACASDESQEWGVGVGLSTPAIGLVMTRKFSQNLGARFVSDFDEAHSVQIDIYGSKSVDTYLVVGMGKDSLASVVKSGFGYEKRFGGMTWSGELGLSLPFDIDKDAGLAVFGYFLHIGLGMRYEF